jgi:hypothetical protein
MADLIPDTEHVYTLPDDWRGVKVVSMAYVATTGKLLIVAENKEPLLLDPKTKEAEVLKPQL